ncbi:hypothetical protein SLS57_005952 [Botryosphaeria dothidea]
MALCAACSQIRIPDLAAEVEDPPGWLPAPSETASVTGLRHLSDARQLPESAATCSFCALIADSILQTYCSNLTSDEPLSWNAADLSSRLVDGPIYLQLRRNGVGRIPRERPDAGSELLGKAVAVYVLSVDGVLKGRIRLYAQPDSPASTSGDVLCGPPLPSSNCPEAFQIPWDWLPKTFRDAITVVRSLGFRYIWIDSLCIVQDDLDEWLRESEQMGVIYERAALTIAACHAKNSTEGCFFDRTPVSSPVTLPYWDSNGQQAGEYYGTLLPENYRSISPEFSPLSDRGKLTNATDRLVALRGLINELQKVNNTRCVHGTWADTLADGLLWFSLQPAERNKNPNHFPSWTWASTCHGIRFQKINKGKRICRRLRIADDERAVEAIGWVKKCPYFKPLSDVAPPPVRQDSGFSSVSHDQGYPEPRLASILSSVEGNLHAKFSSLSPDLTEHPLGWGLTYLIYDTDQEPIGWASLDEGKIPDQEIFSLAVLGKEEDSKSSSDFYHHWILLLVRCGPESGNETYKRTNAPILNINTTPASTMASTAGGFFPPDQAGMTPPASSIASSSFAGSTRLPAPRSKPLKTGGPKESAFIRYVDERIRQIQRRYAKRGASATMPTAEDAQTRGESGGGVEGYKALREACRDVEQLVDVIAYLLTLADLVNEYMKGFPVSPAPLFRTLEKLDHAFASLLQGRDVETGEELPGFEGGRKVNATEKVRINSMVHYARSAVVEVMLRHDPEMDDEEEEEETAGESGAEVDMEEAEDYGINDVEGTWDMKTAKVYDRTLVELGDELTNAPPIGLRVEKPDDACLPKGPDLAESDRAMELDE